MTCIVAVAETGKVWIGGDSAVSIGDSIEIQRDPKVRKRGKIVIGTAGDGRWENVIHYGVKIPDITADLDNWVSVDLCDAIRQYLRQCGETEAEKPEGDLLIGVRGRIYNIDSDWCCFKPVNSYAAIGSGSSAALAALDAGIRGTPKNRIKRALEIAEKRTPFVRRPFRIVST